MKHLRGSWIHSLLSRWTFLRDGTGISSMKILSTGRRITVRHKKLAPNGVEFSEDVSEARWVEGSLSNFGTLRSLLPDGFSAYARVLHPAYLGGDKERPVRWSTVASWTARTVHPLMQFERIAGLGENPNVMYPDPPWGSHPEVGSIPEAECRTLVRILRDFTSTPESCLFCLWEGFGYIDTRRYKRRARVRVPGRNYLLFRGPIDGIMAFLSGDGPFWRDSPNIWWPEDRAWCVATDIDLYYTFVGGSEECIQALLSNQYLEVHPTSLDANLSLWADTINAPKEARGGNK